MRTSIYIAISANGMISNPGNVPDWLSEEYGKGFIKICREKRAVIMGKTTYNILAPDNLPLKNDGTTIVMTSDVEQKPADKTVVFTDQTPVEIISLLEEKGHSEAVIIGGSLTISEFFFLGLVDEVILVMEPVFFGKGLHLFRDTDFETKLNLLDVMKLNSNTIQLHYSVVKKTKT